MKRIIVHLLRGKAREAHLAVTKDLTEKFDSFPLHNRIPPHLTLKRFFELDEEGMTDLYACLDSFVASHVQSEYTLKGYGSFGKEAIYMDVHPSEEMRTAVRDLMKDLHMINDMQFDEYDEVDDDLHATVAMGALKSFNHEQIWDYLKTREQPEFGLKFDNIALLKKETDVWNVERVWEIL
jgi:2'-5' RNA ligase